MANLEAINAASPFKDKLVAAPFDKGNDNKGIAILENDPRTVIKIDGNYDVVLIMLLENRMTTEQKHAGYLSSMAGFDLLSNRYGISVVRHNIVMGENPNNPNKPMYFVVSELVEGQNLSEKEYSDNEKPIAQKKLNTFYTALVDYAWDCYQNGGPVIDIVDEIARNNQFVYGKRSGDEKDNIWLVDVDGTTATLDPKNMLMFDLFEALIEMVRESEGRLDLEIKRPLRQLLRLTRSIPDEDKHYQSALRVRRELQDRTAPTEKQLRWRLKRDMSEYANTADELEINEEEYEQMANKFFGDHNNIMDFAAAFTGIGTYVHKIGETIEDKEAYDNFIMKRWTKIISSKLHNKFADSIEEKELRRLSSKYGRLLSEYIDDKLRSKLWRPEDRAKFTDVASFFRAKEQNDMFLTQHAEGLKITEIASLRSQ